MLMYLDHLENWLVYGPSLLTYLIWVLFWLSETDQIWGFWAHKGYGLKFCMLLYPGHCQNWLDYDHSLLIFFIWRYFDLVKGVKFGFLAFWSCSVGLRVLGIIWRKCGSKCRGGSRGIFPTLWVEFCIVFFVLNEWSCSMGKWDIISHTGLVDIPAWFTPGNDVRNTHYGDIVMGTMVS